VQVAWRIFAKSCWSCAGRTVARRIAANIAKLPELARNKATTASIDAPAPV
jgi:hypothetical protein